MAFDDSVRLIWSLTSNGPATSITTSGNSGAYTPTPAPGVPRAAVDLRWADDVWLSVNATAGSGTTATVQLDGWDSQGNLFAQLLKVTLASSPGQAVAYAGRHGGATASFLVLPEWGRVSWALTGTMTGVEIALYAR
ncbi:MAG TPA: hypothetical protein VK586_24130 [Streptosporangiaceae bacterium]|nr:hypothetical protein [Streptosporangiaceae bacterium]